MVDGGSGSESGARSADELERRLRIRQALSRYGRLLLWATVVVAVVGVGLTVVTYAEKPTTTETETVSTWSRMDEFGHGATVTRENPVFAVGTRLENRSAYFLDITPVMDLTYAFQYRASDGGSLRVVAELRLVRQATAGEGAALWRATQSLAKVNETISPGERVRLATPLHVRRTLSRTGNLSAALGGDPTTAVVADVRLVGRVNGEPVDQRFTRRVTVTAGGQTYRISGGEPVQQSFSRTETRVKRTKRSLPARVGGPLVTLFGLVGSVTLIILSKRGYTQLDAAERQWIEYRNDRSEYVEWIHTADPPAAAADLRQVEAASLRDLVDIAIDLDATVLEMPEADRFQVLHEEYRYVYDAPPRPDEPPETNETDADR